MDPTRRELYVEGSRDYFFLSWLLSDQMSPDATIRGIETIDIPDDLPGGQKGRLLEFAKLLASHNLQIRMFADSDWDRILHRPVPDLVWLTDHRDMEGYVLREECLDKVLRLGIGTDKISAKRLLELVRIHGRRLGLVRLMSELDSMELPFQSTNLRKHLKVKTPTLLDLDGYLQALLQNAKISIGRLAKTKHRLLEVETAFRSVPDNQIVHGKDALCIVEALLSSFGLRAEEVARLVWASYERRFIEPGSMLDLVVRFLRHE